MRFVCAQIDRAYPRATEVSWYGCPPRRGNMEEIDPGMMAGETLDDDDNFEIEEIPLERGTHSLPVRCFRTAVTKYEFWAV